MSIKCSWAAGLGSEGILWVTCVHHCCAVTCRAAPSGVTAGPQLSVLDPEQGQGFLGADHLLVPWAGHGHRGGTFWKELPLGRFGSMPKAHRAVPDVPAVCWALVLLFHPALKLAAPPVVLIWIWRDHTWNCIVANSKVRKGALKKQHQEHKISHRVQSRGLLNWRSLHSASDVNHLWLCVISL